MNENCKSVKEALAEIKSHQTIFIHGAAATPQVLIEGLLAEAERLTDVELLHIHTEGNSDYAKPEYRKSFHVTNLFVGANVRPYLDYDRVDYLPCFLSEMPELIRSGAKKVDVAFIQVSPPDKHGFVSLGVLVAANGGKDEQDSMKVKRPTG